MPTERFYHLSEKKKTLIREAAIKEFCRVPVEKASINKIVQNAEISRGSFYTYFEDKEDLLWYVFDDFFKQVQDFCIKCLEENSGDLWKLFQGLLLHVLDICRENKMVILVQTASGHEMLIKMLDDQSPKRGGMFQEMQWMRILYENTDCSSLKVKNAEEFQILFSLGIYNIMAAVTDIYEKKKDEAEAKKMFAKRLEYIRYGAEKIS